MEGLTIRITPQMAQEAKRLEENGYTTYPLPIKDILYVTPSAIEPTPSEAARANCIYPHCKTAPSHVEPLVTETNINTGESKTYRIPSSIVSGVREFYLGLLSKSLSFADFDRARSDAITGTAEGCILRHVIEFVEAIKAESTRSATAAIPPADPEHDALVKDAARYRWLNKQYDMLLRIGMADPEYSKQTVALKCGDPLDGWIDRHIEAERAAVDSRTTEKP